MVTQNLKFETSPVDCIASDPRAAGAAAARRPAMYPWKTLHNEFMASMEEQDKIVQQRVGTDCFYAYVVCREPRNFGAWIVGITTESLRVRFELRPIRVLSG